VRLIEDETGVRNRAKIMISRLEYKVIEAQNGVEALKLFQEHQNEIVCILSDLTMPPHEWMGNPESIPRKVD